MDGENKEINSRSAEISDKSGDKRSAKDRSERTPEQIKRSRKKAAVIFICVVLSLLVILPILTYVDWDSLLPEKITEEEQDRDSWIKYYGDQYYKEPDFELDTSDDPKYMELDRTLYYTDGNERVQVVSSTKEFGVYCELLYDYFEIVKQGDYSEYYSLFTDFYAEKHGDVNFFTKRELKFTPQKIYNIEVKLIRSVYLEDGDANGKYKGSTVHYFDVSYCIKDNDGTFRRDILSDQSRPLVFELLETDGEVKISDISFYKPSGSADED